MNPDKTSLKKFVKLHIKIIINFPTKAKANVLMLFSKDGDYRTLNVPYCCQFASPELAKDILEGKIDSINDPNLSSFGFDSKKEAAYWSWRICGICCLKMVLNYYGQDVSVSELTKKGISLGGYDVESDKGWYHAPLRNLARSYGLKSSNYGYLNPVSIADKIKNNRFVIASVNPEIIRGDNEISSFEKVGHFVLITGFKLKSHKIIGFYIHNPSGDTTESRQDAFIEIDRFLASYGMRGIVLYKNV